MLKMGPIHGPEINDFVFDLANKVFFTAMPSHGKESNLFGKIPLTNLLHLVGKLTRVESTLPVEPLCLVVAWTQQMWGGHGSQPLQKIQNPE